MRFIIPVLILVALLGKTGCTTNVLQSSSSSVATYLLDAKVDHVPTVKPTEKVLLVSQPKAQPGYTTPSIVYTKTPLTLNFYSKSEWADTPAKMLIPLIVRAVEESGAFRAVLTAPGQAIGDLRLETDIVRLQHEFFEQPSQVRLLLRAKLFDEQTREIIATRLFEAVEPAPSENAYGGVQAANEAVRQVLEQILTFIIDASSRTPLAEVSE